MCVSLLACPSSWGCRAGGDDARCDPVDWGWRYTIPLSFSSFPFFVKLPVELSVCVQGQWRKLKADAISTGLSGFKLWGSTAMTKTSHPWRHFSVSASYLRHFAVCLADFPSTYWYIQSLWSTNYFSLLLTQSYPASCSSDIKFKSSSALCSEFKCLSKWSPMDFQSLTRSTFATASFAKANSGNIQIGYAKHLGTEAILINVAFVFRLERKNLVFYRFCGWFKGFNLLPDGRLVAH